jgi:hypothetical protein
MLTAISSLISKTLVSKSIDMLYKLNSKETKRKNLLSFCLKRTRR